MTIANKEKLDTSWAANSTERKFYEREATNFYGADSTSDVQKTAFPKADFGKAFKKVSRRVLST